MRIAGRVSLILAFVAAAVAGAGAQAARHSPMDDWAQSLKRRAIQEGVSRATADEILDHIQSIDTVLKLDRKQPEGVITFSKYKSNNVTQARIDKGRALMQQHADLLEKVSKTYGVPPQYIVALWCMETNYGSYTGNFDTVNALATLAYEGRKERRDFFKTELIDAIKILEQDKKSPVAHDRITREKMKGSWAGAIGQVQFMPSSFLNLAVDWDGDGHKDIWADLGDAFASAANKLKHDGWQPGEIWGRQVRVTKPLPERVVRLLSDRQHKKNMLDLKKTLKEWKALGIIEYNGGDLPDDNMEASLVAPDQMKGPFYLVYNNYRAIMRWNTSIYFATSVGLLANDIARP